MTLHLFNARRHSATRGFTALESVIVLAVIGIISWVLFALWKHGEPLADQAKLPVEGPPTMVVAPEPEASPAPDVEEAAVEELSDSEEPGAQGEL